MNILENLNDLPPAFDQNYQDNGLYVTGNKIIAWLETWGGEHEQPVPLLRKDNKVAVVNDRSTPLNE